ncbi:transposase [[Clostridium] ultunense Esp]|uniref:IS21 family transposase n=1 Tax=Thermicanus aegyptius TaxID=94009 RepID=UPI0002B6F56C|nr:IS21 family transposase [Thermicanus aegyptius]CCQ94917.1 transposase [[Clostridium] ultunense Esp]
MLRLGRDRKTIRKWLKEGVPDGYHRQKKGPGKLEPFKDYIRERMNEGCLNAVVLLEEIRERGYQGGPTILRDFMQPLRPQVQALATVRFETPPGKQAQVDWGEVTVDWNGTKKKLHLFVMTLGFSRMVYVEFMENEKLTTLIGCHLRAMQYFGGITETVLYDNMKTVVTGVDEKGEVIWNERFARFAEHHGFILKRCRPYRPRTKGKVENGVKYVKQNFWPRIRTFTSLAELNRKARDWMETYANVRIHGTTHERPIDRFALEKLNDFNGIPFENADRHSRKVSSDCLVSFPSNLYSVPYSYVGQKVEVLDEQNGRILIFHGQRKIAEHI